MKNENEIMLAEWLQFAKDDLESKVTKENAKKTFKAITS